MAIGDVPRIYVLPDPNIYVSGWKVSKSPYKCPEALHQIIVRRIDWRRSFSKMLNAMIFQFVWSYFQGNNEVETNEKRHTHSACYVIGKREK